MLSRSAEDVAFAAMLGECFSLVGVVVNHCFHADWNKWVGIVVVGAIQVRIR